MKSNTRKSNIMYINRKEKQLIIETPIHTSTTKTTAKDGKVKKHIKYTAHIPNMILIFLLEKFASFDAPGIAPGVDDPVDVKYIDKMLNSKEKFYLSFFDNPGKDVVETQITNEKFVNDNTASVTIKKQFSSNSYFFTVSKKLFSDLKNNNNSISSFRFVLSLDSDSYYFKNFIVCVELV